MTIVSIVSPFVTLLMLVLGFFCGRSWAKVGGRWYNVLPIPLAVISWVVFVFFA